VIYSGSCSLLQNEYNKLEVYFMNFCLSSPTRNYDASVTVIRDYKKISKISRAWKKRLYLKLHIFNPCERDVEVIYDSSFVVSLGLLNVTLVVFHNIRWGEWSCSWFPGIAPKAWRVKEYTR